MWIARNKDNSLYKFSEKPYLEDDIWTVRDDAKDIFMEDRVYYPYKEINSDLYPEITFENSPKELN